MAQILVRKVDKQVVDALKFRAALKGHSLEQEIRQIITAAARPTPAEIVELARRIRAMTPKNARIDSTKIIRQSRDRGWS
ncbi:MAG: hypothetical protein FJX35_03055 [Alphaproteobacteria bacterium]|nr:hypothetical protein [Alphaproteobacteria bacterium]